MLSLMKEVPDGLIVYYPGNYKLESLPSWKSKVDTLVIYKIRRFGLTAIWRGKKVIGYIIFWNGENETRKEREKERINSYTLSRKRNSRGFIFLSIGLRCCCKTDAILARNDIPTSSGKWILFHLLPPFVIYIPIHHSLYRSIQILWEFGIFWQVRDPPFRIRF